MSEEYTSEKYRCRGCSWTCLLQPNTGIVHMPKVCPFINDKLSSAVEKEYEELKPIWERDHR